MMMMMGRMRNREDENSSSAEFVPVSKTSTTGAAGATTMENPQSLPSSPSLATADEDSLGDTTESITDIVIN